MENNTLPDGIELSDCAYCEDLECSEHPDNEPETELDGDALLAAIIETAWELDPDTIIWLADRAMDLEHESALEMDKLREARNAWFTVSMTHLDRERELEAKVYKLEASLRIVVLRELDHLGRAARAEEKLADILDIIDPEED
jgi:hypothetical protein